jgi:hypothetical protein
MRRSARTDLCGGRSVMIVPTASLENYFRPWQAELDLRHLAPPGPALLDYKGVSLPLLTSNWAREDF